MKEKSETENPMAKGRAFTIKEVLSLMDSGTTELEKTERGTILMEKYAIRETGARIRWMAGVLSITRMERSNTKVIGFRVLITEKVFFYRRPKMFSMRDCSSKAYVTKETGKMKRLMERGSYFILIQVFRIPFPQKKKTLPTNMNLYTRANLRTANIMDAVY
jgi:hypothetical protein